jgi:surface carbohydrate biosynthesis protein (TIGR04326 family)
MSRAAGAELWVCFEMPGVEPPRGSVVLSFMSAGDEERAEARWGAQFVNGRVLAERVRPEARRHYVDLIARIAATPCLGGATLRHALRGADGCSRWWLHKTSEKDCGWDEEVTYVTLVRGLCVRRLCQERGIGRVRVFGGDTVVAAALAGRHSSRTRLALSLLSALVTGVLSRLAFLKFYVDLWRILRRAREPEARPLDVVLEAHWDWSLRPDGRGGIRDRYSADLPDRLERQGLRVGWFAWCEPSSDVWQRGRRTAAVLAPALDRPDVIVLERELGLRDILSAALRIRYLVTFLRFATSPIFRRLFRVEGLELYPVMLPMLVGLFARSTIPRGELLMLATERACRRHRPKLLLTFLELFLHTRAMYAGARRASVGVRLWTAQHGAYCSDKTGAVLDPARELRGEPDGCGLPAPDRIFAMGHLAGGIWEASGFSERVLVTGGLRFQHVSIERRPSAGRRPGGLSVLLIGAMTEAWDLDLCEAATLAARDVPGIRLRFRDHPSYCLSERPGFARFRGAIEVTRGTVDEDLDAADLVLFTYSGLAEEALLRGLPVWQWLWAGVNPTVFGDLAVVPTFASVTALRDALRTFAADPAAFQPDPAVQEHVLHQCFGPSPAHASARIAEEITSRIAPAAPLAVGRGRDVP